MRGIAAIALLVALAGVAPAHAEESLLVEGGCFLAAATESTEAVLGRDQYVGVFGSAVAIVASKGGDNPVPAQAMCSLVVNGHKVAAWGFAGSGAAYGAEPLSFTASDYDSVELCTEISSAGQSVTSFCKVAISTRALPDEILDAWCDLPPNEFVCDVLYDNRLKTLTVLPPVA